MDIWLVHLKDFLIHLLPESRQNHADLIILMGGILGSLYSLLQFLVAPFWGRLSDRFGRRPVLITTSLGLSASYLIWTFSPSFTFFIISRIVGGIMAGNLGVATASMADMSESKNRTNSMGLLGAAFGIGFIVGPVVGGLASSWRPDLLFDTFAFLHPFSGCALLSFFLSIGSGLLNLFYFKETKIPSEISSKESSHWISNPFKSLREIPANGFFYVTLINFFYLFLFSGFEFTLTFFYKLSFGLSPMELGFIFLYLGFILALGQGFLVRRLSPILREKKMTSLGIILLPASLILFSMSAPHVYLSLLFLFPVAIGSSLVMPSLTGLASLLAPDSKQGYSMGVFRSAGSLARAVGPISGAYLYWIFGVQFTYFSISFLMLLVFFLTFKIKLNEESA